MKLTVFGANGRVGSLVVAEALQRGHKVRAFVHGRSRLPKHDRLEVVKGNIYDAKSVAEAVKDSEVVMSALGSWGTPRKDILTVGMEHIIPAMEHFGLERIVSLTGAGALDDGDRPRLVDKISHKLMEMVAGKILQDGEVHIQLLRDSDLDWTVVRSPVMNSLGSPDRYALRLTFPSPLATINRAAVAKSLVDLAESGDFKHQSPVITRR